MSLPFTTNRFLPINIKGSDAITGTYGGVSILNNGKAELKSDTTITRLGINGNTNPIFDLNVSGTANITTLVQTPRITYTNGVSAKLLTTQSSAITVSSGVMSFTATNPEATFQSFKTQFYGSPFTITSVDWPSIANMPINGVWTFYIQNITSGDIIIKNNIISSGTAGTYLHTNYPADVIIPNTYGIVVIKIERAESVEAYLTAYITSNAIGGVVPNPYVLPVDATFENLTATDTLNTSVGSITNIGGGLNVGSSGSLVNNITTIFGERFNFNDGISEGVFMVGSNNFFIDMDNSIAQTSIGQYDLYADLVKVETFDYNINNGLDVGVVRMGNDFVFDCVNHTLTDNTLIRNIPNATTTTKDIIATNNITANNITATTDISANNIIATNNITGKRLIVDGKCQLESLKKVNYSTATDYYIEWGDANTVMVLSSVAQNIYLPAIPADDTKNGMTFRILKATGVSVILYVAGGATLETEDNDVVAGYTMVGLNRYIYVSVAFNSANNRTWRIVASQRGPSNILGTKTFSVLPQCTATPTLPAELITKQYADATYTGGGGGALLTSNNTWSGTNLFNNNLTMGGTGYFLPYFPATNTSLRIGLDAMKNSTATSVNTIAIGNNALQGTTNVAYDNKFIRCVVIGGNAMKTTTYGTYNTANNDNIVIGYNAAQGHNLNTTDNVIIGSQCLAGLAAGGTNDSVVIGSKIGVNGGGHTFSVIIGSKNFPNTAINNGTIVGYGNFANSTLGYANGLIIYGDGNMTNCGTFNRVICIGSGSLLNLSSQNSTICIGIQSLIGLSTGGYVSCIGSFITTTNNSLSNTTIIGTNSTTGINNVCYFGGNDGTGTPTFQDLLPANKNRLLANQTMATSSTLAFETGEHVNITSSAVSTITLPATVLARNIGARFTLFKNYTPSSSITITSGTNGIRTLDNSVQNTYLWASPEQYITLVCIATTSPMWAIVGSQYNETAVYGFIDSLIQQTQGIGYTNATGSTNISEINTDPDTSPQLTIGFGGGNPSITTVDGYLSIAGAQLVNGYQVLTGSPNNLVKPLKEYYALGSISTTCALTLPVIDSTMYGSQITFVKSSAASTWVINAGSGNTFRLYKSDSTATATSITLALNNTVLKIVATANVWEVIQTDIFATPGDWVLATKYCPYKTFPTTISVATNWDTVPPTEFCKYVLFSNSGTGSITLTLPQIQNAAVFEGMEFVFRRTNTAPTASTTSVLAVARGGTTDLIYIQGAMTTSTATNVLPSGQIYGKIVCVSKSGGRWAYFPS